MVADQLMAPQGVVVEKAGTATTYRKEDFPTATLARVLKASGEVLKRGISTTRRVEGYVIKSAPQGTVSTLKRTLGQHPQRRGWTSALWLEARGINVPPPRAYVEYRRVGFTTGACLVSDYLDGYSNVEAYARTLVKLQTSEDKVLAYLMALARAVNDLSRTGAYHRDLSGKNVFTRDGESFSFIDLDSVEINVSYTDDRHLKNLVQLYDSFCDYWPDRVLKRFVAALSPETGDEDAWFARVRDGQAQRRARIEAIWRGEGKIPDVVE